MNKYEGNKVLAENSRNLVVVINKNAID